MAQPGMNTGEDTTLSGETSDLRNHAGDAGSNPARGHIDLVDAAVAITMMSIASIVVICFWLFCR